ncbi:DUF192 domain-containing protein [Streptomyces sp. NPDC058662]|uniref:DUF192 domain-containing protein n=1 Tax=Streptomyces sp. NPDC058662 TaxID=3346583 RepID=UPI00365932C8
MGRWRDGTGILRIGTLSVPLEVAASYRARTRGLLGRGGVTGALLLSPAASVHTFRMRFAIDVAHLDRNLRVLSLVTMAPGRLGLPRPRARHVLEAEAGALAGWGLRVGDTVGVDIAGVDASGVDTSGLGTHQPDKL